MWAVIEQAVECVLSLFILGLVGFVLARKQWFPPDARTLVPRLVTIVTLPPYLFKNIVTTFNREELLELIGGLVVPAISILTTFILALAAAKLLRMPRNRAGMFSTICASSNTIFIGLPVNIALFGEAALPYVLLYFFANTVFFWTIGNYQFSLGGDQAPAKILSRASLKHLFSPPLLGFALGVLSVLAGVAPPRFLMDAAGYLGSLTTPLAIIFIGVSLASVSLKHLIPDRDIRLVLLGRFIVSPLTIILLMWIIKIPPLMGKVFIIQSSLPTVATATLLAGYYNLDTKFASVAVSLTTLMAVVTIPFYMAVITSLNFQ
ncbi:MAG: AEC family transporter [Candidatus Adiutrix sp.]|jgi:predicted permease|nr:AEC family transporter [Candidatus Adiutrix sp.]